MKSERRAARARRIDQPYRVARHFLGDHDLRAQFLELEDVGPLRHARGRGCFAPVVFVTTAPRRLRQVVDDDVEHEAIELRFRQRIGAFELDRILGRQHEERLSSGRSGRRRDVVLLHRLEQRACVLGGVRLISSARMICAKTGPFTNAAAAAGVLVENLGARDVDGIRSGVN
jgi:hypothetical protein